MIEEKIKNIALTLPEEVTLVAVSKTKPNEDILRAYNVGQRIFGENKVQELVAKFETLPKDIEWHMIGHLQTNKVKYIAPFIHLIHSIDSIKLLKEVNKEAKKNKRTIKCLLQFHIAQETTKFGFSLDEVKDFFSSDEFIELNNIELCGVMGMATFSDNKELVRDEFQLLHNIFHILKSHYFKFNPAFKEISMGMSDDYQLAMKEGSTMVRIGSTLFGGRN
jgi:pyridoxal phosphate enzyme (YggS family)